MPPPNLTINRTEYNNKDYLTFHSQFDPVLTATLRRLPNAEWLPALACWGVPDAPLARWLCLQHFPDQSLYRTDLIPEQTLPPPDDDLPSFLYPFQREGVRFLRARQNAILADCPGSGKTLQAIVAAWQHTPTLVCCPASVTYQWREEIRRVESHGSIQLITSSEDRIASTADWIICSRNMLTALAPRLVKRQVACLIVDEAHDFRNADTVRTKALMSLAQRIPTVYLLTGTPIFNRVSDLFPLLVSIKQVLPENEWFFLERYCAGKRTILHRRDKPSIFGVEANGLTHADELRTFLAPIILRRNREQIDRELPPLTRRVLPVTLTNPAPYDDAIRDLREWIQQRTHNVPPETRMIRINHVRQTAAYGKVEATLEQLQTLREAGEKAVVLCSFLGPLDKLKTFFPKTIYLNGEVPQSQRHRLIAEFQRSDRPLVALCSMGAAGVGITLTAARYAFLLDVPWTPAQAQQAEARIYRESQTSPTCVTYIVGMNSIDMIMLRIIKKKAQWAKAVFEGGDDGYVDALEEIERAVVQQWFEVTHD